MAKTMKMRSNQGTEEVNFEGKSYRVQNGEVEVPSEAASALLLVGGFSVEEQRDPVPAGFVRVCHPDGATSCSWSGVAYNVNDDGSFDVPAAAVADLLV